MAGFSRFSCAFGAILLVQIPVEPAAGRRSEVEVGPTVERFLARPRVAHTYVATRRLEASGVGQRGWIDARTGYSPELGLSYEVLAEGGSGYIRARVLRSLLSEEQQLIARRAEATVALTADNYEFVPEGPAEEDGLVAVGLRPRRKDRALIAGRMLLTRDGELRRIEGRLAKSPSFWVTRVDVVRRYQAIHGVPMPVSLETRASLRLLGASQLQMTYRYLALDDRTVEDSSIQD